MSSLTFNLMRRQLFSTSLCTHCPIVRNTNVHTVLYIYIFKGIVARDFLTSDFFHSGPLIHTLKYFRIQLQIRRDIRIRSLTDRYTYNITASQTNILSKERFGT
jgi:hypothetical protein